MRTLLLLCALLAVVFATETDKAASDKVSGHKIQGYYGGGDGGYGSYGRQRQRHDDDDEDFHDRRRERKRQEPKKPKKNCPKCSNFKSESTCPLKSNKDVNKATNPTGCVRPDVREDKHEGDCKTTVVSCHIKGGGAQIIMYDPIKSNILAQSWESASLTLKCSTRGGKWLNGAGVEVKDVNCLYFVPNAADVTALDTFHELAQSPPFSIPAIFVRPVCIPCPVGWAYHENTLGMRRCFKYLPTTSTLDNAKKACWDASGSWLASIHDSTENQFLVNLAAPTIADPNKLVWIGASKFAPAVADLNAWFFTWNDNTPTNFVKLPGTPSGGKDGFVLYIKPDAPKAAGDWNDGTATNLYGAICQRNAAC